MQRLGVLKLALMIGLGLSAGVSLRTTGAEAAPLTPTPLVAPHDFHRAVTSSEEAARLTPQQVRWGHHWHHHHWHRHWHHRHWGWRHRHWGWRHHHHWGWRHHHWHRHHWRHW